MRSVRCNVNKDLELWTLCPQLFLRFSGGDRKANQKKRYSLSIYNKELVFMLNTRDKILISLTAVLQAVYGAVFI